MKPDELPTQTTPTIFFEIEKDNKMHYTTIVLKIHTESSVDLFL